MIRVVYVVQHLWQNYSSLQLFHSYIFIKKTTGFWIDFSFNKILIAKYQQKEKKQNETFCCLKSKKEKDKLKSFVDLVVNKE